MSKATIVQQGDMVADMARSDDKLNLIPMEVQWELPRP